MMSLRMQIEKKAMRVLRGGAWNNHPANARAAYRNDNHRDNDWNNTGFRLALSSHKRVALLSDEEGRKFMGPDFASCLYDEPQGPRGAGRALSDDSEPNVLRVTRSAEFSFFANE
jgi:hypothetical protein